MGLLNFVLQTSFQTKISVFSGSDKNLVYSLKNGRFLDYFMYPFE